MLVLVIPHIYTPVLLFFNLKLHIIPGVIWIYSSAIKCHSFVMQQQFSSNHPIQASFVAVVIVGIIFFNSGFMHIKCRDKFY